MNTKSVQDRYLTKFFHGSSHWWAEEKFKKFQKGIKVLDIGPGSGFASITFQKDLGNQIFAIEIDEKTREILAPKYNGIYEDLSQLKQNNFDLIIMLDVLEHMTEPENFLDKVKDLLKPDGAMLISVPNVAHWSVRLPLLFGIFDYYNRGILDKTHYQFFTRKRVREIIKNLDLNLIEENSSIEPLEFVLPKFITSTSFFNFLSKVRQKLAKALPGFFAYQHLVEIKLK